MGYKTAHLTICDYQRAEQRVCTHGILTPSVLAGICTLWVTSKKRVKVELGVRITRRCTLNRWPRTKWIFLINVSVRRSHSRGQDGSWRASAKTGVTAYQPRSWSAADPRQEFDRKILAAVMNHPIFDEQVGHTLQNDGQAALSAIPGIRPFCFKPAWLRRSEGIQRISLHSTAETNHYIMGSMS